MAALMLDKLKAITKVTSTEVTDKQLIYSLNAGSKYVVESIPKHMVAFLASAGANITDGSGQTVNKHIVEVRRNGITCMFVPLEQSYFLSYSGSLYEASSFYPKYFIRDGKVYIKPDPTASAVGVVSTITPPVITATTDSDTINYSHLENIILLYASALTFTELASYFSRQASDISVSGGDARDALDKAKNLIDGTETTDNAQDFIDKEDSEMVVATIQTAQQEVQRALAEMKTGQEYSEEAKNWYLKANDYFKLAGAELAGYINTDPSIMQTQIEAQARQQAQTNR